MRPADFNYERTLNIDHSILLEKAKVASRFAYAQYSQFPVGAAVVDGQGRVFVGCNVENASFGLTICAERVAIFSAVAAGARAIHALAIYTPTQTPTSPCGACRQVIREFGELTRVTCGCLTDERYEATIAELLPLSFSSKDVTERR